MDAGRPEDIATAERFINEGQPEVHQVDRAILGITREPGITRVPEFSPGKEEADSAILRLTFDWLAAREVKTRRAAAEDPGTWGEPPGVVLSMAQGEKALSRLAQWEAEGVAVLNTTDSVRACSRRESLFAVLQDTPFEGFALPRTVSMGTGGHAASGDAPNAVEAWNFPVWMKRGDLHALGPRDVLKVNAPEGLGSALSSFADRGIDRAVCQEHVGGEEIRFYGVGRERFWFWRSVADRRHLPFSDALSAMGRDASSRLGLDMYGGDAVITPDGDIFLIDLNDWPSFTGCQADASDAIADLACMKLEGAPGS